MAAYPWHSGIGVVSSVRQSRGLLSPGPQVRILYDPPQKPSPRTGLLAFYGTVLATDTARSDPLLSFYASQKAHRPV